MGNYCLDVKAFHDKFGLATPTEPQLLEPELRNFRVNFLREELQEFVDSTAQGDLATAIDSVIDHVYVTCGAYLLHGFDPAELASFHDLGLVASDEIDYVPSLYMSAIRPPVGAPALMDGVNAKLYATELEGLIGAYALESSTETARIGTYSLPRIKTYLKKMYYLNFHAARLMGFDEARWDILWADVQRANMSKERALNASDSKRGSTYDVIKPAGWVPPNTEEILRSFT